MKLPQHTTSLPGGTGQWDAYRPLPHCLGAVGSGTPTIYCLREWGYWAMQLLPYTATLLGGSVVVQLVQYSATLPGGGGQRKPCNALPHCLRAVGSASTVKHCDTAWGQRAVQLLQYTASIPRGSGQCNWCNTLLHYVGAVGSVTRAMQCLPAWGRWALLQYTASMLGGSMQCKACNTLPHRLGAAGSVTPALHCPTTWGQWVVLLLQCLTDCWQWALGLVQCDASLPRSSGQCKACNTPPHCLGAVAGATLATHCLTAWGH